MKQIQIKICNHWIDVPYKMTDNATEEDLMFGGIRLVDDSECEHKWYTPDFGDKQANDLGTVCRKCDMWKDDYKPKPKTKIKKLELGVNAPRLESVLFIANKLDEIIDHLNKE